MICYVFIITYFIVTSWTVVLHISVLLNFQTVGSLTVRFLLVISSVQRTYSELFQSLKLLNLIMVKNLAQKLQQEHLERILIIGS